MELTSIFCADTAETAAMVIKTKKMRKVGFFIEPLQDRVKVTFFHFNTDGGSVFMFEVNVSASWTAFFRIFSFAIRSSEGRGDFSAGLI